MAKAILPYKVKNNLAEYISIQAEKQGKTLSDIENELAAYCSLTVRETRSGFVSEAIKKYKEGKIDPSLPVAIKIADYFGVYVEDIFQIKEV